VHPLATPEEFAKQLRDSSARWIVTVSRSAPSGLSSPAVQAWLVFGVWLVMGLMAFGLLQVLARGRARALRMVEEKTGQLRHQALHDALTGLPNRALIMDRTEQMLAHARANGTEASAMFIDLDGFKGVNDAHGHRIGDDVLAQVGQRITGVLRPGDVVGRLGGDEFAVLCPHLATDHDAFAIAERIVVALEQPFEAESVQVAIGASVGIATTEPGRLDAEQLIDAADRALYRAKGEGRGRWHLLASTT